VKSFRFRSRIRLPELALDKYIYLQLFAAQVVAQTSDPIATVTKLKHDLVSGYPHTGSFFTVLRTVEDADDEIDES